MPADPHRHSAPSRTCAAYLYPPRSRWPPASRAAAGRADHDGGGGDSWPLSKSGHRGLPDTVIGRRLRRHRLAIIGAAEKRGATNVRVFGSVARGEDNEDSDVDLLVDLADDVGIVGLIRLEREIAEILRRKVDVVPARCLKADVASVALAQAIPL
jgi:predicted nucleotidyltransferase